MSNFSEKIKDFGKIVALDRVFIPLLIILVGSASFALGRLSVKDSGNKPIQIIETTSETAAALNGVTTTENPSSPTPQKSADKESGKLVGSKNGTKYHFPWCSGAARITEINKVWFESAEEARAAGYTPAANCKGLE
jgi:hypothetical protein